MKRNNFLHVVALSVLGFAATIWTPIFAQEHTPDQNTLLLLHFNNSFTGAQGETPTQAQGVNFESGIFGDGAYFAPGNQVYFPSTGNISSTEGTLEFWIKPRWNGNDGQGYAVLRFGVGGGTYFAKDGANNWRSIFNRFGVGNPEVGVAFNVSAWQANQWHHAAFTWKSEVLKLYVDGQLLAEEQVPIPLNVVNETTFQLGADFTTYYLDAVIDELRISDIERTAQEIYDSFARGSGAPGPIIYSSHFIDDDTGGSSIGDGDGRAENGERVELAVQLLNQGAQTATGVTAKLSSSDPDVTIIDNENYWPDIPGGAVQGNLGNFGFDVNLNLAQNKSVTFTLTVSATNAGPWTSSFTVPIYSTPLPCTYTISPAAKIFEVAGGTSVVNVAAGAGCGWTALSHDSWIAITSGNSGSGHGAVNYMVAANTLGRSRTGKMTVAGQTFTVTQAAECGFDAVDDFEDGNANGWTPLTADRWEVRSEAGSLRYFLNTTDYGSPDGVRLGEISVLNNLTWKDFNFECAAKSADAAAGGVNADLCVIFGYQDFDSYYYMQYNSGAGLTRISRIDNGAAVTLASYAPATFADGNYHALRVERKGNQINAFFDGNQILSATDSFFGAGQIAIGSFNDSGYFDNLSITCPPPPPPFTEISATLTGIYLGACAWGDYDNDGDLDILLTGDGPPSAKVYRNDNGSFVDISASLIGVSAGSAAWGDYDNDGDLDILVTGVMSFNNLIAKVYKNDGGNFVDLNAALTGVYSSSAAWGDYDNDGDLDIALIGTTSSTAFIPTFKVYRNDQGNFVDSGASLPGFSQGSLAWGDYDKDGDLDILVTGVSLAPGLVYASKIYRNDSGNFVDISAALVGTNSGSVAWGDYDNDGDLDILLTGEPRTGPGAIAKVYRNDNGSFADISAGLAGVLQGSVAWGDYDNDGDLDILLAGNSVSKIYRNDNGSFVDISASLIGVKAGSVAWGDYDNDRDLDILLTGSTGAGQIAKIYRNNTGKPNTVPITPTSLSASVTGNTVTFNWAKSTDDQTSQNALTYNLRVGKTPGGSEIVAPMANATIGYRRVQQLGNANHRNSWALKNLANGTYYWSVQAIDNAFTGSAFATEKSFTVVPPVTAELKAVAPTTQSIGASFDVQVDIGSVQNLFGLSFELNYTNTAFVEVVTPASSSIVPGSFLGNDVVFVSNVDEAAGKVSIGITRKTGQSGVSGSGDIAKVKLTSLLTTPPGTQAVFSLSNVVATDPAGNSIPLALAGATVTFSGLIVWPGDTNNDGIVNQADVLPLGLHWGKTGPARQNASVSWTPQAASPWTPNAATYADANGNGLVNQGDVLPIGLHWGKTHASTALSTGASTALSIGGNHTAVLSKTAAANLSTAISGNTNPGQDFWIDVKFDQASNLFGLAFELLYSPTVSVDPLTTEAGSFLGNDVIFFPNVDKNTGKISIGLSRKAGQGGVNGSGIVARIKMHASNQAQIGQTVSLNLQNAAAVDSTGQALQVSVSNQTLVLDVASRENELVPATFMLHANVPNPFNPSTMIHYDLAEAVEVSVEIFDMLGKHVRTLVKTRQPAGRYAVAWDGRDDFGKTLASGVFIYQLRTGPSAGSGDGPSTSSGHGFVQSRKMLLVR